MRAGARGSTLMLRYLTRLLICLCIAGLASSLAWRAWYVNRSSLLILKSVYNHAEPGTPEQDLSGRLPLSKPQANAVEASLEQAMRLQPQRGSLYRFLAQVHSGQDEAPAAQAALEQAHRIDPGDPLVNGTLGWRAWTRGDAATALGYFRQAPHVELALARQAGAWASQPAYRGQVLELYQTVLALKPETASIYYDYADLILLDRREEALEWYERGKAFEPVLSRFYERRAGAWLRLGQPERAIQDSEQAVALAPDNAAQYYQLGDLLSGRGRWQEALQAYDQGRQRDRDTALVHIRKGKVYAQMGRTQDAIAEMQRAIEVESRNFRTYYELGEILREYGQDYKGATAAYQQSLALAPGEMWPQIGMGETFRDQGQYDRAAEWFARAQSTAPQRSEPYYFMGLNSFSRQDWNGAISYLRQALAIQDDQVVYYRYLGEAYAQLGQWDAAIESYQRLLKLSPGADYARQRLAQWQAQKK